MTSNRLAPVLIAASANWRVDDFHRVLRAYHLAERLHEGQRRYSGDPYIVHLIEVATIVANQGASPDTVCAALLHDALDETSYSIARMRAEFGGAVADQVTALVELTAATVDSADRDVVLLKLADRLHNMRTIQYVAPDKQRTKSADTLHTLVPLAHHIGTPDLGQELAGLASRVLRGDPRAPLSSALRTAVVLLPRTGRARWLAEWSAELAALPSPRARRRFIRGLLVGMPRLAWVLRRTTRTRRRTITLGRLVVPVSLGGTWAAGTIAPGVAWAFAATAAAGVVLAAAVLFATIEEPARRLRELIESWRHSGRG